MLHSPTKFGGFDVGPGKNLHPLPTDGQRIGWFFLSHDSNYRVWYPQNGGTEKPSLDYPVDILDTLSEPVHLPKVHSSQHRWKQKTEGNPNLYRFNYIVCVGDALISEVIFAS